MAGDEEYGLDDDDTKRLKPAPSRPAARPAADVPAVSAPSPGYPAPVGPPSPGYPAPGYPQAPAYAPPGSALPGPPGMLTSAADRERATDLVKAAFGEGRLGKDEFDSRCARVLSARTYHDLAQVVADLPGGSAFVPAPSPLPPPGAALIPAPYAAYPAATRSPTSGMAVASVICAILGVFPTFGLAGIPGVILGHLALGEIRQGGKSGRGAATTGLVIGYLAMAFWALIVVLAAAG